MPTPRLVRMAALICLLSASSFTGIDTMSLEALFRRHGTDKQASYHAYVHAYSMMLGPWREHIDSLLEVGIGTLNHSFAANMGTRSGYTRAASIMSWLLMKMKVCQRDSQISTF